MKTEITFDRPITINGQEVTRLTMREPTVEDELVAQEVKGSRGRQEAFMFANLCDTSPEDIGRMPKKEYLRLVEAYEGFLV